MVGINWIASRSFAMTGRGASLRAGATQSSWWLARGCGGGREMAGINWIASRSFAMTGRGSSLRACEAIQLVVGEGLLAWERRVWHQLDRFTFVRDDGEGGVIASGSDAIQLVVQEEAGLPRRFAPRNDGRGGRSLAMTGWGSSLRACEAIQLVVQEEAGLPRRFAPRNDGWGLVRSR